MKTEYKNGNVISRCPDCNSAYTTFEHKSVSSNYGVVIVDNQHNYEGNTYLRIVYMLLRCAGCGRGGLAKIHDSGAIGTGKMEGFFPVSIDLAILPAGIPSGVASEFREAELCASVGAWRASSGLLRSTLEKLLRSNGYSKGALAERINQAAEDGVITEARKKKAHDEVRVLGNDVLHDDWRQVSQEEVELSHHYVQRIAEDFYDDRSSVEAVLIQKGRIPKTNTTTE